MSTDNQHARLSGVFAPIEHAEVEATWGIYQRIISAYRDPHREAREQQLQSVIDAISSGIPAALAEV